MLRIFGEERRVFMCNRQVRRRLWETGRFRLHGLQARTWALTSSRKEYVLPDYSDAQAITKDF